MKLHVHSTNADPEKARLASYDGDPHVVVPVVAVVEGVLKDKYLPQEEIALAAPAFNGVPLPVGHPADVHGNYVSANSPDTLDAENVGRFFNVSADGPKMKGEAWVDVIKSVALASERAPKYGASLSLLSQYLTDDERAEISDALDALPEEAHNIAANDSGLLEVSTAYWFIEEEGQGTFDGNAYDGVQRHILPDHLALLPHQVGECSVEDGCGAPRVNQSGEQNTMTNGTPSDDDDPLTSTLARTRGWVANRFGGGSDDAPDAANDCGCGCGGECGGTDGATETMNHEKLKEMGLSDAAIEAMSDEDIAALAEQFDADDGDDGDDPTQTAQQTANDADADDDRIAALTESVTALAETVESMQGRIAAQEQKERDDAIAALTENSDLSADDFESVPTETLQALASERKQSPTAADMGGRVPFGMPAQEQQNSEDGVKKAKAIVAALNNHETETDE